MIRSHLHPIRSSCSGKYRLTSSLVYLPLALAAPCDFRLFSEDRCTSSLSLKYPAPRFTLAVVEISAVSSPAAQHLIALCAEFPIIGLRATMLPCIRGMASTYLSDCITICNEFAIRDTRNSTSTNLVTLPYASLDMFKNSFAYRGPFIWNALPNNIKKCVTISPVSK